MQIATRLGVHLACALAITGATPGCITYSVTMSQEPTYRELAITSSLGAVEIGGGLLGGYLLYRDEMGTPAGRSLGASMLGVTGGFLVVDAFIALILWASDNSKH